MIFDRTKGAAIATAHAETRAIFALALYLKAQEPSDKETIMEKTSRLTVHIQREPPRDPVNSYHCIDWRLRAKALPRTSHGHEISRSK